MTIRDLLAADPAAVFAELQAIKIAGPRWRATANGVLTISGRSTPDGRHVGVVNAMSIGTLRAGEIRPERGESVEECEARADVALVGWVLL